MSTLTVHLARKSDNVKTGPIPVSTSTAATCPACPFKDKGCYAASGPLALHWRKVTAGERGTGWGEFCETVATLPEGQLWRHNQAGDLPGNGDTVDRAALDALVMANKGRRGFTYTHKPVEGASATAKANRAAVSNANVNGFTVNLSANNLPHADRLAGMGIAPVVTVLPLDYQRGNAKGQWTESMDAYKARLAALPQSTPEGRKVVVCPATYRDDVSCATCQLCQRQRNSVVGFPAHGVSKKAASAIAAS